METRHFPWNYGKVVGQKPPLKPREVWAIRVKLQIEDRKHDLALFNLAIDSKLRGCDLVAIRVSDVASGGDVRTRSMVVQQKTHKPVQFEITELTRIAISEWLAKSLLTQKDWLFPCRKDRARHITTRQYARLVSEWIAKIGLAPRAYGTHSMRRTKASIIYRKTGNIRAVQLLLGHTKLDSTVMRDIRTAVGAAEINPALLTAAERIQYEGYLRREETNAAIKARAADGLSIKEIVRRTGHSRKLVRSVLRGEQADVFRCRENSLEPFLGWLDDQWTAGDRNGARLWRRLKAQGFRGSLRVVTEWATRRRRAEKAEKLHRTPAARSIARMMTTGRDKLTKSETVTIATIEKAFPALASTRDLIDDFHAIVRKRASAALDQWLNTAREGLISSFANGMSKDIDAVRAAIELPWSNGQTEAQITKLKLVKRQMYGRGKLDLLEARLIGAT